MRFRIIAFVVVAVLSAVASISIYRALVSEPAIEVSSPLTDEMIVMRTKGGLLEVSKIRAVEVFESTVAHSVFFMNLDPTVTHIRLPAVYTYRVPLAPEWIIRRVGTDFVVVAPRVEPSLPVAVDLAKMEKNASGTWTFFTATGALDKAEREITAKLAKKATSAAYVALQSKYARQTVAEFVRKWLISQERWQGLESSQIRVLFADETIDSLGPDVFPIHELPAARKNTN